MKWRILLVSFWLLIVLGRADAQQVDSLNLRVPGALYLDVATIVLAGNASINYEHPIMGHTVLRVGFGLGYAARIGESTVSSSSGVLAMVNFLSVGGSHRGELGLGCSLNRTQGRTPFFSRSTQDLKVFPAFTIGYRYHPYSAGSFFRIGLGYTFAFGFPLYISGGLTL